MRSCLAIAALVLVAACESASNESSRETSNAISTVIDSSGAVPVVTVAGEAPEWSLDSLAVIRAEPSVGFSRVRSIALDPRGGVWVADVGEKRLMYFGDNGAFIEERGRVGSGPGEFRSPTSIAVHDGGLIVHDLGNGRMVRFSLGQGADTSWLISRRLSGDAMFVRIYPNADAPLITDLVRDTGPPRQVFARLDRDEYVVVPPRNELNDAKVCHVADGIRFFSSPFSPRQVAAPLGDGTVSTEGGDYQLDFFDRGGVLRRTIIRPVEREVIDDAEFLAESADWQTYSSQQNTASCEGEIVRYPAKPAIRAILPDADGRLWIERRMPGRFVYELWSGDSLIARVPAPERESGIPPAMLGDRIAVVAESPDDGHEVRLYRVRKPRE